MCKKLIQIYACGHTKTICTTACPHAIETGRKVSQVDAENGIMRSISSASTMVMFPLRRGQSLNQSCSSPIPRPSIEAPQATQLPLANQPTSSLERPNIVPTSPTPSYRSSTVRAPSSAPALVTSPSVSNHVSLTSTTKEDIEIEPNFCPYYFPHNLPQSNHPCIDCSLLPEWEHRVERWMTWYKNDNPLGKVEDVERLSGVEYLKEKQSYGGMTREREGKLNVFVDGDENAGRVI